VLFYLTIYIGFLLSFSIPRSDSEVSSVRCHGAAFASSIKQIGGPSGFEVQLLRDVTKRRALYCVTFVRRVPGWDLSIV
jgi:hypothetical protein